MQFFALDGQAQQRATAATNQLSDQNYAQGQRRFADAYRGLDPFEAALLGLEESAIRRVQQGLANAALPGGGVVWRTMEDLGTGIRESRQAGGDLEEQLRGGVSRAFPVVEKYQRALQALLSGKEELPPFLRGFLQEELAKLPSAVENNSPFVGGEDFSEIGSRNDLYDTQTTDTRNPLDGPEQKDYTEYESYVSVLGELAPSTFEEFQAAKNDPEVWGDLQRKFQILDMYKMDSGSLTPTEIFRLDSTVFHEKREKFSSNYTHSGNIAGAFLDGDEQTMYYAHSKISNKLKGYKGNSTVITLKNQLKFSYIDVQKENGEWRRGTYHDTEAKLFEYFADLYKVRPFKSITMISERGMCKSCQGVMEQFQKQFPDVTITVVSNKRVEGDVWGYRR